MPCLSVVERELRVAARRRATHRIRFWAVLAILGLFAWRLFEADKRGWSSGRQGEELFFMLSFCTFIYAVFIGVVATSDCVSEEKREGTLGLLFLTDLKGSDVILGKLAANSLNAFYGLVAVLPILGIPLLLGGVSSLQFIKAAVALLGTIVLSLSAGIFVSTFSRNERKAMVFSFLFMLTVVCVPFLVMFWLSDGRRVLPGSKLWMGLMFSPGFALGMAMDDSPPPGWPVASYWYSVMWTWLFAAGLLALASAKVPRSWDESHPVRRPSRWRRPAILSKGPRRQWLDRNPFMWLALRGETHPRLVWMFVLAMLAIWLIAWRRFGGFMLDRDVVLPTVVLLHGFLKIWIVAEASRRFVEDRRNNAFELLLSTPLSERQIIRGQWLALLKQFAGPIVLLLAWEVTVISFTHHWHDAQRVRAYWMAFFLVADGIALGWAGMWLGLKSKGRGRAMLMALGLVLLLPWILSKVGIALLGAAGIGTAARFIPVGSGAEPDAFVRTAVWVGACLLANLLVILWARSGLLTKFRRLATAQHSRTDA